MFCQIVTLPRSGSHMLGSAIGCHTELHFAGEPFDPIENERGLPEVQVLHYLNTVPKADKYIVLIRDPSDRDLSWQRTTSNHFDRPTELSSNCENPDRNLPDAFVNQEKLESFAESNDCLILHYDDITGNTDTRVLPEKITQKICSYLGLAYRELCPDTYKPTVLARN